MIHDDIQREAVLHTGDEAAQAHARTCPACAAKLAEAGALFALIERAREPAPSRLALARAAAPVRLRLQRRGLALVAVLLAFAVPLLFAHQRARDGWTAAALVVALSALLASTTGVLQLGALLGVAASAGFAVAAAGAPVFAAETLYPHAGLGCLGIELAAGALAFILLRRSSGAPQAAVGAALAAQAALHLICPGRAEASHLWTFHVGGVLLVALGTLAARRLLPRAVPA